MHMLTNITARILSLLSTKVFLPALLLLCALGAGARDYASSSVMSEGKWVKITIKEEGMQILTPSALKSMGFSDPAKVHVYGYGGYRLSEALDGTETDDLPQQPVVRTADGSIIFYGTGMVKWDSTSSLFGYAHYTNFYSTVSTYFLSDRAASDISPEPLATSLSPSATAVNDFTQLLVHEQDLVCPGPSGADMLGEDFRTTSQRSFSFPLVDPVGDRVRFCTVFASNTTLDSRLLLSSGGTTLGNETLKRTASSDIYVTLTYFVHSSPMPSDPKADITLKFSGSGVIKEARLDYILASYQRKLRLSDGILQFRHRTSGNQTLRVEGCSQSTLIWDVTDPAAPRPVKYELQGSTACFAAPAGSALRTYIAFNPASVKLAPTSAGSVANQDIHSMETPDMVIITPDVFKTQAERLAQFHRDHDDMTVTVLSPEAIFNEFASGKPDVTAFRKMLKMFYDRGKADPSGTQLQHCLLFGRPSYDHRLITDVPRNAGYPRLLTWQDYSTTFYTAPTKGHTDLLGEGTSTSYCTDNYIGCLENDRGYFNMAHGQMSIGVGRMPVKSVQEAKTAVDKLIAYVTAPDYGAWRSHIMLIADDADNGAHLNQMQQLYDTIQMESYGNGRDFITERLYLDSYPLGTGSNSKNIPQARERMFKLLNEGVSFLGYVGHANPTSWTHEGLMTYTDINSLSYKHLPIIFHASCEFVRFDSDTQSGAETMWLNPSSGAIAFIAANRSILISYNGAMCSALGKNIYQRDADGNPRTLGEIYYKTINDVSYVSNKNCFTLMGDPAMRIPSPVRKVKIEKIDDTDLRLAASSGILPVVPARAQMKISGKICLPDGSVDTGFNGTVTATLFDAERVIETYGHSSIDKDDGKVIIYNDRKNRLAIASFQVKEGVWESTLFLPEEIENNYSPALLAMYACTPEGTEAMGSTTDFYVYGFDDSLPEDTEGPEIESIGLGSKFFRPGDTVGSSTTFLATVRDDSGINISSAGIGKQMTVMIDGRRIHDDLSDYFMTDPEDPTAGSVEYPLTDLPDGEHELIFQVFDNAGNCAKASLAFKVGANALTPDLELRTDASPASVEANIFITSATMPGDAVVEIFDMAGRMVWSSVPEQLAQSMSVKWDLTDKGGVRVPRGIYLYRATITGSDGTVHRRTRKIAVTAE